MNKVSFVLTISAAMISRSPCVLTTVANVELRQRLCLRVEVVNEEERPVGHERPAQLN